MWGVKLISHPVKQDERWLTPAVRTRSCQGKTAHMPHVAQQRVRAGRIELSVELSRETDVTRVSY